MDVIKSSADITLLFTKGRRIKTPYLTFIVLDHRDCSPVPGGRVAFIAGKKLGNAVWRNNAKRRMREICRQLDGPWMGSDIVMLAKQNIIDVPYGDVLRACKNALSSNGYVS